MSMTERILGACVGLLFRVFRRIDPDRSSDLCGWMARSLGPLLPAHRVGRVNLQYAFPEKDQTWIECTLRSAWENLGRVAGEYVHLGRLWDYDPAHPNSGRIETSDAQIFYKLRHDGKPALAFAAHLANWELPAVAAATHGLPSAALYRMPNNRAVAKQIARIREGLMGRLIAARADAVLEIAASLEKGEHVGMLVDQHFSRGVQVNFFGRPCRANPMLARLARQFDCPIVGVRVIRLPGNRFRVSATGPIQVPRDAEGNVLVQETMQQITSIIEGWIREHPGQWLWFHRRWR